MNWLLSSFFIFFASSVLTLLSKTKTPKRFFSCGGVVVGSLLGLVPAFLVLQGGSPSFRLLASPIPGLNISLGLDPLSAFFLVGIFVLSGLVAVYGWGYIKGHGRLAPTLPFFPLLVASMAAVVTAHDGFFFLIAWEGMSLASFFLVTAEHEVREVRHAGWIYLVATHLATAFLLVFFILLFKETGSFSFENFSGPFSRGLGGLLFVLAVIGFGTKAGIFPMHVWLPHAHPAAPSYISALMSGVMIKTGIYGILRALTFIGPPPLWWGELLIGLGIVSAVLGVLYALMQHDLKRLLAYHSVENIGIIVVGMGLGLIGVTRTQPSLVILGFGGALFHVWNHALFKGLLFLGAGAVVSATHTRTIDRLGGLIKNMPITGGTFLVAGVAICGLPPLNGFISEWLIYVGLFQGVTRLSETPLFFSIAGIVAIAFAGGLAIACFTKVVGVVFLGEPRSESAAIPHEVSASLLAPMVLLAFLCAALGFFPQIVWPAVLSVVQTIAPPLALAGTGDVIGSLGRVSQIFWIGLALALLLLLFLRLISGKIPLRRGVTWDCGYAAPTYRMQYTASSFAEPLGAVFQPLLRSHRDFKKPSGLFPPPGSFSEHTEDLALRRLFNPLFGFFSNLFGFLKKRQWGRIQGYLAFILGVLILLLLWEVWFGI